MFGSYIFCFFANSCLSRRVRHGSQFMVLYGLFFSSCLTHSRGKGVFTGLICCHPPILWSSLYATVLSTTVCYFCSDCYLTSVHQRIPRFVLFNEILWNEGRLCHLRSICYRRQRGVLYVLSYRANSSEVFRNAASTMVLCAVMPSSF